MRIAILTCLSLLAARATAADVAWWCDIGAREATPATEAPADRVTTLKLLAPKNGVAHGQVLVRLPAAVTAATASVVAEGDGALAADELQLAWLTNTDPAAPDPAAAGPLATVYPDFVPTSSSLVALYVTFAPRPDAAPGVRQGTLALTVTAGGTEHAIAVPVETTTADYLVPASSDLDLWISLMQSPAQLTYAYGVQPFSEEHWRVVEASTRLLGEIGHHVLFLPVLWHANCGSGPQMVCFRREGDTLVPDFTQLDRYLALVRRHCGPQRLLVLGVWGRWLRSDHAHPALQEEAATLYLTLIQEDGSVVPHAIGSDYAANEALWRAVYRGVVERAAKVLDLPESRIVLGYGDDTHPEEAIGAFWDKVAPGCMGWEAWTHDFSPDERGPRPAFFEVVDTEAPDGVDELLAWPLPTAPTVEAGRPQVPFFISTCRVIQNDDSPAALYYSIPDLAVSLQPRGHTVGFSRIGLDFWPKTITLVDGTETTGNGYARDGRKERRVDPRKPARDSRTVLTARGPQGALPLVHFGALREGVQAAQARLTLARGISEQPDRAKAWREAVALQFEQGARHAIVAAGDRQAIAAVTLEELQAGWGPLFRAAGEAQRALGLVEPTRQGIAAEALRRAGQARP